MKIGSEELNIQPETKQSLDIELLLLHLPLFTVIFIYASGNISWPIFYLLFHFFEMRFFT